MKRRKHDMCDTNTTLRVLTSSDDSIVDQLNALSYCRPYRVSTAKFWLLPLKVERRASETRALSPNG